MKGVLKLLTYALLYQRGTMARPPHLEPSISVAIAAAASSSIFASLTTLPLRIPDAHRVLQSFEVHEPDATRRFIFWVVVDRAVGADAEVKQLQNEHKWTRVITKNSVADFGQARSLNLILRGLQESRARFWLKWEDSWIVSRPFVLDSLRLMLGQPSVAEVHVCSASMKAIPATRAVEVFDGVRFRRRHPSSRAPSIVAKCDSYNPGRGHGFLVEPGDPGEKQVDVWPNFSLRPGIIRASLVLAVGPFDTQASLWPYKFETLWACRFFLAHPETVDQFLHLEPPATFDRNASYMSTYRIPQLGIPAWLAEAEVKSLQQTRNHDSCKCGLASQQSSFAFAGDKRAPSDGIAKSSTHHHHKKPKRGKSSSFAEAIQAADK